jgi:hypothetical protein
MTEEKRLALLHRMVEEAEAGKSEGVRLTVILAPESAIAVIASLQLALRHPGNSGTTARVARGLIGELIEQLRHAGLDAFADVAEMGNDPANDEVRPV